MYLNLPAFGIVLEAICGDLAEVGSLGSCCGTGDRQTPHRRFDLLAGGLKAQVARSDVDQTREDERRLVPMQLADLERDDSSLGVREHREREDRLHSEGRNGLEAALLADQDRVVDLHLASILNDRIQMIDGNSDNFEGRSRIFTVEALEKRELAAAGLTPRRPEIHDQRAACPVGEAMRLAV